MQKKRPIKEMVGKTYGRLTVLALGKVSKNHRFLHVHCECGTDKEIEASGVRRGSVVSCGCWHSERISKHGMSRTKEYHAWEAMLARCFNKNSQNFKNYGGRGITVCEAWLSFENFFDDMGLAPKGNGISIERNDVNGNYEPGNCRWATCAEQANNKRTNRFLTLKGRRMTIAQWSKETGLPENTIRNRLRRGWSDEKTLTESVHWNPFKGPRPQCVPQDRQIVHQDVPSEYPQTTHQLPMFLPL